MPLELPKTHLLTCAERVDSLAATLRSWEATDWGAKPQVFLDEAPHQDGEDWGTLARSRRVTAAYAAMLRGIVEGGGRHDEWLLLLNDDLEFHPRLAALVQSWTLLEDATCGIASLFKTPLAKMYRSDMRTMKSDRHSRAVAVEANMLLGAQAILLRFWAVKWVLARWDSMVGLPAQRLARLFGGVGPIWMHDPSLVQHAAADSSWGPEVQRAPDFDPGWMP